VIFLSDTESLTHLLAMTDVRTFEMSIIIADMDQINIDSLARTPNWFPLLTSG
jgi:hypothetical protein